MWRKATTASTTNPKIQSRVQRLAEPDLIMWADQAIYTTGRYLTEYHKSRDMNFLDEAVTGAQVLNAVVDELKKRHSSNR